MTDSGAASCTCTYIQDTTYESITVIFTAYSYYVREASTHNNPSITIITLITRTFTPVIHINKKTWSNKADQPTLQTETTHHSVSILALALLVFGRQCFMAPVSVFATRSPHPVSPSVAGAHTARFPDALPSPGRMTGP